MSYAAGGCYTEPLYKCEDYRPRTLTIIVQGKTILYYTTHSDFCYTMSKIQPLER